MLLALISDVHGNLVALRRVLNALSDRGVDEVICLGDVAASGPQPSACLDLLEEHQIPVVLGNTDAWLLDPTFTAEAGSFHRRIEEVNAWCAEQLSTDNWHYLRSFPPLLHVEIPVPLLCFHGTPRNNREVIKATTPIEELAEIFRDYSETWLAGGHTHQQLLRQVQDRVLINPGSVGLAFQVGRDGKSRNVVWAEYAVIDCTGDVTQIELCRLPFDEEAVVSAILASGMPYAEEWAAAG